MSSQTTDFLSHEEAEKLLASFSDAPTARRNRLITMVMLYAGLRVSEALRLKWDDVQFTEGKVVGQISVIRGKRGKSRFVPLAPRLETELQKWKKERPKHLRRNRLIFTTLGGGIMGRHYVWKTVRRKGRDILKRRVFPHLLRHTFGNWIRQAGKDVKTVQDLMGHTRSSITIDFYYNSTKEDREGAILDTFDRSSNGDVSTADGLRHLADAIEKRNNS